MNSSQKMIVAVAATVMVLMLFFPPFQVGTAFSLNTIGMGYGFIGSPPIFGKINFALLLVQWAAVAFLAVVLVAVARGNR